MPFELKMHSDQAAADNKKFIDGFLLKFPEYKTRDFYLTSESYGGHYLPTLAQVLGPRGRLSKGLGFRSVPLQGLSCQVGIRSHKG
jgi:carboxypeptidase C (cathepsin A)